MSEVTPERDTTDALDAFIDSLPADMPPTERLYLAMEYNHWLGAQ